MLDATIVRLALTPALMTLLRERNWTGPRWSRRTSQALWRVEHETGQPDPVRNGTRVR